MRLEGLTCSCLGCRCEDNRDESGPSLSGHAKSAQEFHLSPGSGQRPPGSALTGLSQQPSIPFSLPSHQYHMTLLEKAGKEGSTRWVAERDSLAGPRMCGPRGRHSWTLSGCGRCRHLTVHSGRLPLLGTTCLSAASFLLHAHWPDLPSRCSRCATPSAMVAQCLCTY